jgi:hypothetical protein
MTLLFRLLRLWPLELVGVVLLLVQSAGLVWADSPPIFVTK